MQSYMNIYLYINMCIINTTQTGKLKIYILTYAPFLIRYKVCVTHLTFLDSSSLFYIIWEMTK